MKKIVHFITGLGNGGAESMLYKILKETDLNIYEVVVVSFTSEDYYVEKIESLGIKVEILDIKSKNFFVNVIRLLKICRGCEAIQSWMYHANLIGFFIAKILKKKIIWGVHHSNLEKDRNKSSTIFIAKKLAFLSRYVNKVVYCGEEVLNTHLRIGYSDKTATVIFNGFDTLKFKPSKKREYYKQFQVEEKEHIMIHVGRWDPLKDYPNLLEALKIFKENTGKDFKMFLVGNGLDYENIELKQLIELNNLTDSIVLLGPRDDIAELMAGAEILLLSSIGEGLPNVLGEALLSGTVCVATDVGDCKNFVKNYGEIVPAKDPIKFAAAIVEVLNYDEVLYNEKINLARSDIQKNYDITNITDRYYKLYN